MRTQQTVDLPVCRSKSCLHNRCIMGPTITLCVALPLLQFNCQGPLVLPWSELVAYGANSALRQAVRVCKPLSAAVPKVWLQPYTPDFTKAFDFFCIHTGGRGIIDGLEKEMQLSRSQVEPSRASLYRFGNTSSTRWVIVLLMLAMTVGFMSFANANQIIQGLHCHLAWADMQPCSLRGQTRLINSDSDMDPPLWTQVALL